MAKRIMAAFVCASICLSACATITNIAQCLNIVLTEQQLTQFPDCDNSSPQNCLLGFVKGSITGDYLLFLSPLSDSVRVDIAGVSDLSQITATMTNNFYTFVVSSGFSNHVVCAYSETATNNSIYAKTFVRSQRGLMNKTNEVQTVMRQIGNGWRIVEWDVDE